MIQVKSPGKLFPGRSIHKIVRFYFLTSEEGCSETDMRLFVWNCKVKELFKVIRKDNKKLPPLLLWFFFCWVWIGLTVLTVSHKPIWQSNIYDKDLFQVSIWEIDAILSDNVSVSPLTDLKIFEIFIGRMLYPSSNTSCYKICVLC